MKQLVTLFIFLLVFVSDANAQVCQPKNPTQKEEENLHPDTSTFVAEPAYFDVNHIGQVIPAKRRIFNFGYGVNSILRVNQNQVGLSGRGLNWFDDHLAPVFDVSGELGMQRKWVLGFTFGFQKLGRVNRSEIYLPDNYLSVSDQQGTSALTTQFELKAHTYSPMMYTEFNLVSFWKHFQGIARAELGLSIYRASIQVNYQDTCGCTNIPVSDWEMSTSFNAGAGLGVKWEYRFIGLKALLIYQSQTRVKFKSQEDYQNYTFDFDASQYDFRGTPNDSKFTISKAGDESLKRYNPLYVQFMLYFRLGGSR